MTREVRPLARAFSLRPTELAGVHRAWRGSDKVAAVVGIGPVAAGRATERLLDALPVDRVVVVGVAGAVDPALRVTDVVIPDRVLDRASGTVFRPHRPGGRGTLVTSNAIGGALAGDEGPEHLDLAAAATRTVTGDGDGDQLTVPVDDTGGLGDAGPVAVGQELPPGTSAVDMETAAIARACEARGVQWWALRTISDVPGTLDDSVLGLVRPDGGLDLLAVTRLLARRPGSARHLARIGWDTQRAVRALTLAALREL